MLQNLARQLRGEEGEILHAYPDHLGYMTIGVGRLIDSRKQGGITAEESAYLLNNDIKKRTDALDRYLPWWRQLNDPRQAVLVQMAFQIGTDGLLAFKNTLANAKAGKFVEASNGMLDSLWARQTPARAKRLADQMRTGEWVYKEGF